MSFRVFDPREQKGLQTPTSTPSDFEIRWDEILMSYNYILLLEIFLKLCKQSFDICPEPFVRCCLLEVDILA